MIDRCYFVLELAVTPASLVLTYHIYILTFSPHMSCYTLTLSHHIPHLKSSHVMLHPHLKSSHIILHPHLKSSHIMSHLHLDLSIVLLISITQPLIASPLCNISALPYRSRCTLWVNELENGAIRLPHCGKDHPHTDTLTGLLPNSGGQ